MTISNSSFVPDLPFGDDEAADPYLIYRGAAAPRDVLVTGTYVPDATALITGPGTGGTYRFFTSQLGGLTGPLAGFTCWNSAYSGTIGRELNPNCTLAAPLP